MGFAKVSGQPLMSVFAKCFGFEMPPLVDQNDILCTYQRSTARVIARLSLGLSSSGIQTAAATQACWVGVKTGAVTIAAFLHLQSVCRHGPQVAMCASIHGCDWHD